MQHTDQDDLDPIEIADQEELQDDDATVPSDITDDDHTTIDPDVAVLEEVDKVATIVEDEPAKQKPNMIPRHLIDAELKPEDLWDEGTI